MKAGILFALVACAGASPALALTAKPLTTANKLQIAAAVKNQLKDPDSAKFKWPAVQEYGIYCGWVNSKNSYGGYTGFKLFMVIGGRMDGPKGNGRFDVGSTVLAETDGSEADIAEKMCSQAGFDIISLPSD